MTSSEGITRGTAPAVETLDSAFEKIGHGRMQRLVAYVCAVTRVSGQIFAYNFAFLILKQKFLCSEPGTFSGYESCSAEYICAARETAGQTGSLPFNYIVDTNYDYYLNNWYIEMDLMCQSSTKIAFMFTMYFVGNVVGGCLAFLPDRIGRKNSVIFGLIISLIT